MKKNALKYVAIVMALLLTILVLTAPAIASEDECRSVLHKCTDALDATQKDSDLQRQINKDQVSLIDDQQKQIHEESIWKPIAEGSLVVVILETLILSFKK